MRFDYFEVPVSRTPYSQERGHQASGETSEFQNNGLLLRFHLTCRGWEFYVC